jgi:DNA-binding NarL/FixJ family response regulator
VQQTMINQVAKAGTLSIDPMTVLGNRELHVYRLIGQGLSTQRIAQSMNVSPKTVESHRRNMMNKLNITGAAALVHNASLWVVRDGQTG